MKASSLQSFRAKFAFYFPVSFRSHSFCGTRSYACVHIVSDRELISS